MRKIIKRILIVLSAIIVLFSVTAYVLLSIYKKELLEFVTQRVNENVYTPVDPLEAEWTVISSFPYIGITLNDVIFRDTLYSPSMPVVQAKKIRILFDISKLLTGKIVVRKLQISNASYVEYKDDKIIRKLQIRKRLNKSADEPAEIELPEVELINITVISENAYKANIIKILVERASASVTLNSDGYIKFENAQGILQQLRIGELDLLLDEPFRVNGNVLVDSKGGVTRFESGTAEIAGLDASVKGTILYETDTSKKQHLEIVAHKNSTSFLRAFLPDELKGDTLSSDSSYTEIKLIAEGVIGPVRKPDARISFLVRNGRMQNPETGDGLTDIDIQGAIIANDSLGSRRSRIRLTGSIQGKFGTLDLYKPPPEYAALFSRYSKESGGNNTGKSYRELPEQVALRLQFSIGNLVYKRASFRKVKMLAYLEPSQVRVESLKGEAFGGSFSLSSVFSTEKPGTYRLSLQNHFSQIDLPGLFRGFSDFGQTYIQSQHMKGKASLDLSIHTQLNSKFEPILPSLEARGKIKLSKPELIGWPLLTNALKLIKNQAEHIYIADSELDFVVRKNVLYLAPTEIMSNLTRFQVSSITQFDQNMDLLMRLNLADQLLNSSAKRKEEVLTGDEKVKKRDWGFVHIRVNGKPGKMDFNLIKKEEYHLLRDNHGHAYRSALNATRK